MRRCVSCLEMFTPWSHELSCFRCSPSAKRVAAQKIGRPKPSNLILSDGGKSDIRPTETNDCTVRAIAIALDIPYERAYGWLARNGRKRNQGCNFGSIVRRHNGRVDVAPGYRLMFTRGIIQARGLKTFLERNPQLRTGVWILHSTRHASTLKDGTLYDSFDSTRKTFDGAWAVWKENE